MAVLSGQVVCPSNTPTVIVAAANANTTYQGKGSPRTVVISNPSAQGIYIGGTAAVSSSTGLLLAASTGQVTLVLNAGDAIYGVGASSSPTAHYLITGT